MRPRSNLHGNVAIRGFGEVPAVQITVFAGIRDPSLSSTASSNTRTTLVPTLISTFRSANFFWAYAPSFGPSRQDYIAGMNQKHPNHVLFKVWVKAERF